MDSDLNDLNGAQPLNVWNLAALSSERLNVWNNLNPAPSCSSVALLHVHVDEIGRAGGGLEEIPALHPVVGALEFIGRDRRRID